MKAGCFFAGDYTGRHVIGFEDWEVYGDTASQALMMVYDRTVAAQPEVEVEAVQQQPLVDETGAFEEDLYNSTYSVMRNVGPHPPPNIPRSKLVSTFATQHCLYISSFQYRTFKRIELTFSIIFQGAE